MSNPYMDRVTARMRADNALEVLQRHWTQRAITLVDRPALWLERIGFNALADRYCRLTGPLVGWLADEQARYVRRRWL